MSPSALPLWVTIPGTVLLVLGGLATLVGSIGLLRLPDFFSRMHGPSMTSTMGTGAVLLTSMLALSASTGRPTVHELLIAIFLLGSAPISTSLMIQAALHRAKMRNRS
jgi:multicomponent K+:H+ antiporter subunit G